MPIRASSQLRVFHELARVAAEAPYDLRELLQGTCAEIREAFEFERALVALYDTEGRSVHALVQQGIDWPGKDWLPLSMFPLLERALEERRAVFVAEPLQEGALPGWVVERFAVQSVVALPLVTEGRTIGFLVADHGGRKFELSDDEVALLTAIGAVTAVFIDKADQYERLQQATEELRRLDRVKSEFISIASHELRTPIAVVHGVAATLYARGDELPPDRLYELRRLLHTNTDRLTQLTEQLLDLSRIDAGAVTVAPTTFAPRLRCEELLPRIAPEQVENVDLRIDPDLEVTADPSAFDRVLANLVTNALRYGQPPVRIVAVEARDRVVLAVEDHGDGVDPRFVPRLFERFTRSDHARQTDERGAGLGLAIASSYAQALGGDLRYEPARPRGARFILELPT